MEQLLLELAAPEPSSFENFVTGTNAEAVAAVTGLASGQVAETGLLLWGGEGCGKTHLLQAAVRAVKARGGWASLIGPPQLEALAIDALGPGAFVAVDDIDRASAEAQAQLFSLYNALRDTGGHLLAACRLPLAKLRIREDVRTRLGWGLVYALQPLADDQKPAALVQYARQRGFMLSEEVIRYLLHHGRRDIASLLATLAALDRHSLATKRPITVPLLREWVQREMRLER